MASSSSHSLEVAYATLKLLDDEDEGLVIDEEAISESNTNHNLTLVGSLITEKPIKFQIMKDTLASVWRPGKGMQVTEISSNLFLFHFFHELDLKRIMEDGPWAFEQNLLVLRKLKPNESPQEATFTHSEFWIQAHNVPPGFVTEKVAMAIGSHIGNFIQVDKNNFDGKWKAFMRVRVEIDITKPLKRRMKLKKPGGEWFWINFKYERLPTFCFW